MATFNTECSKNRPILHDPRRGVEARADMPALCGRVSQAAPFNSNSYGSMSLINHKTDRRREPEVSLDGPREDDRYI